MRKRQINNYGGGFKKQRGRGVTVNWNTTPINTTPSEPISPNNPTIPIEPNIPVKPIQTIKNDDGHIAAIVGLGALSTALLASTAYYYKKSNLQEFNAEELPGYERRLEPAILPESARIPSRQGVIKDETPKAVRVLRRIVAITRRSQQRLAEEDPEAVELVT
jgi:hypothetical protein